MDQGIGKIMDKVRALGVEDDTLVMFLSDNGGCAEFLMEDTDRPVPSQYNTPNPDGTPIRMGNIPGIRPGPSNTYMSYDLPWANASNTPFRLFKRWTHEGGISTPFIISWPKRIKESAIIHEPTHIIDIAATCIDAAGATYPSEHDGNSITPIEGESFLAAIDDSRWSRERPILWEHEGSRAVRDGQWKLVSEVGGQWELYDMDEDRTELNDLAEKNRAKAEVLANLYDEWAELTGVIPWPVPPHAWNPIMRARHNHLPGKFAPGQAG